MVNFFSSLFLNKPQNMYFFWMLFPCFSILMYACNKAVTCSYVNISYISDTLTFLLISNSYFYGFVCDILLLYVYIKRTWCNAGVIYLVFNSSYVSIAFTYHIKFWLVLKLIVCNEEVNLHLHLFFMIWFETVRM